MRITKRDESTPAGIARIYRLTNSGGAYVELSSIGAGILSVTVPDGKGVLRDVVLGYSNICDYLNDGPCMGKTPGRYANRIGKGRFSLDGKEYRLAVNCGPDALHGGPEGFHNRLWDSRELPDGVLFSYVSKDGEEGYPGNLTVEVLYRWDDSNTLHIEYRGKTDSPTVLNLTNHTYFNLGGCDSGTALNHELRLFSSRYLLTDSTLVPTGEIVEVASTPMDFRDFHTVGERIGDDFPALRYGKGYDNCWVLDTPGRGLRQAATLIDRESGRVLDVFTTQPAVQVYSGNWLEDSPEGKDGYRHHDYDGIAIECQGFPDAPNKPHFPSQRLDADEEYLHHILFRFGVLK